MENIAPIALKLAEASLSSLELGELCERFADILSQELELDALAFGFTAAKPGLPWIFRGSGVALQLAQGLKDQEPGAGGMTCFLVEQNAVCSMALPLELGESALAILIRAQEFSHLEIHRLYAVRDWLIRGLGHARHYQRAKELAWLDDLTQVYNRRYLQHSLDIEIKRAQRFERPLSLIMIDVDYFKRINDSLGHKGGDQVLAGLAQLFQKNLREIDTLSRYGGEEFALILPDTAPEDAVRVAEKLRQLVLDQAQDFVLGTDLHLSISLGVSGMNPDCSPEMFLDQADIALYRAKAWGRNRVELYEPPQRQLSLHLVEGKS